MTDQTGTTLTDVLAKLAVVEQTLTLLEDHAARMDAIETVHSTHETRLRQLEDDVAATRGQHAVEALAAQRGELDVDEPDGKDPAA